MKIEKEITFKTKLPDGTTIIADSEEKLKVLYKQKTIIESQKLEVNFPTILIAQDYHDFDLYEEILAQVTNKKISYREFDSEYATYVAIFWVGEGEPIEETTKMINEFEMSYK